MTLVQQDKSDPQRNRALSMKRPISERKLQANRANAKRSTGPRTEAGKAASCRNALKHGILSRAVDLPLQTPGPDLGSPKVNGSIGAEVLGRDSALQEISRIWGKLTRVVVFEKDCAHQPKGLERHGRLICRYERMLTRQLHARIRECAGLESAN
jgi:hypothetical protein